MTTTNLASDYALTQYAKEVAQSKPLMEAMLNNIADGMAGSEQQVSAANRVARYVFAAVLENQDITSFDIETSQPYTQLQLLLASSQPVHPLSALTGTVQAVVNTAEGVVSTGANPVAFIAGTAYWLNKVSHQTVSENFNNMIGSAEERTQLADIYRTENSRTRAEALAQFHTEDSASKAMAVAGGVGGGSSLLRLGKSKLEGPGPAIAPTGPIAAPETPATVAKPLAEEVATLPLITETVSSEAQIRGAAAAYKLYAAVEEEIERIENEILEAQAERLGVTTEDVVNLLENQTQDGGDLLGQSHHEKGRTIMSVGRPDLLGEENDMVSLVEKVRENHQDLPRLHELETAQEVIHNVFVNMLDALPKTDGVGVKGAMENSANLQLTSSDVDGVVNAMRGVVSDNPKLEIVIRRVAQSVINEDAELSQSAATMSSEQTTDNSPQR